jgi:hypothetical protein
VLKEVLLEPTLGQSIWLFITKITEKFILGAYDMMVALKCHMLQLGQDETSLWHPSLTDVRGFNNVAGGSPGDGKKRNGTKLEDFPFRTVHSHRTLVQGQFEVPIRICNDY